MRARRPPRRWPAARAAPPTTCCGPRTATAASATRRGASSNGLMTGWAALGLGAARKNPAYVERRRGRTVDSLPAPAPRARLRDLGELERTILVLQAGGPLARVASAGATSSPSCVAARRGDGSFRGQVSYTAFGILALKAAGKRVGDNSVVLARARAELRRRLRPVRHRGQRRRPDRRRAPGARRGGRARRRRRRRRRSPTCAAAQNSDGGFGFKRGADLELPVDRLRGAGPGRRGRRAATWSDRALGYLKARQRRDGSIAYSAGRRPDAGLGHRAGAGCAAAQAVSRWPRRPSRGGAGRRVLRGRGAAAGGGRRRAPPTAHRAPPPNGTAGDQGSVASRPAEGPSPLASQAARVARSGRRGFRGPSPLLYAGGIALALLTAWFTRRRLRGAKGASVSEKPSAG